MVKIELEIESLSGLREDLCVAQSAISQAYAGYKGDYVKGNLDRIQKILDQIDILRPLGPDGKHRDRHTEFCGCENPEVEEWYVNFYFPDYEMRLSRNGHVVVRSKLTGVTIPPYYQDEEPVTYTLVARDGLTYRYADNLLRLWLEELKNG